MADETKTVEQRLEHLEQVVLLLARGNSNLVKLLAVVTDYSNKTYLSVGGSEELFKNIRTTMENVNNTFSEIVKTLNDKQ